MATPSSKRPLRVLYIDHTAKIGGGEIALLNLVRHLDPAEIVPIVLLFEDGPLAARLTTDIETHILPLDPTISKASKDSLGFASVRRLSAIWGVLRHIGRVARIVRKLKVDIVHTNSLKADVIGGIAGRLAHVPVVWHVRDRITPDYLPGSVVKLFRALCRTVPSFVIANSRATLATINLGGRRPSAAIGSGVVLSGALAQDQPLIPLTEFQQSPRIGLVGRISPWKGQHIFLQAAQRVLQDHPKAVFEVIGSALFAEKDYEHSLRELCRDLEIEHAVSFVGFVDDVPSRLRTLDIFVHASTTGEPFGQVIVEAMAACRPVVATRGGGVPEIVVAGETGLLVEMGNVHGLADAINFVLANPKEAQRMGIAGRERVLQHFTIQKTVEEVKEVYRQLRSNEAGDKQDTTVDPR